MFRKTHVQLELRPARGEEPLPTLEGTRHRLARANAPSRARATVGAINLQLSSCPFLNVTAVDLQSRHARIKEARGCTGAR